MEIPGKVGRRPKRRRMYLEKEDMRVVGVIEEDAKERVTWKCFWLHLKGQAKLQINSKRCRTLSEH